MTMLRDTAVVKLTHSAFWKKTNLTSILTEMFIKRTLLEDYLTP